jgi:Ca2+-binding EF-hand superfamily protein
VLEKALFTFISNSINATKDETKLLELFLKFDKNGDGSLSTSEINEGYDFIGTPPPPPVQELLKKITSTGATIHYQEFIEFISRWNKNSRFKELEKAFLSVDKGGDGKLSLEELAGAIPGIEGSEWGRLLEDADVNGDGMITLEELKEFIFNKMK